MSPPGISDSHARAEHTRTLNNAFQPDMRRIRGASQGKAAILRRRSRRALDRIHETPVLSENRHPYPFGNLLRKSFEYRMGIPGAFIR